MTRQQHIEHLQELRESLSLEYLKIEAMLENVNSLLDGLLESRNGASAIETASAQPPRPPAKSDVNTELGVSVDPLLGFRFDPSMKIDGQLVQLLRGIGHAVKKSEIDSHFVLGKKAFETRHAIRRLKKTNKIKIVSLGGSKRYTYWALGEWVSENGKLFQEFAPYIDGEQINTELLGVKDEMNYEIF